MIESYVYWLQWALIVWLAVLFAMVLLALFRGDIRTHGILQSDQNGDFDPERLALLLATVGTAIYYGVGAIGLSLDDMTRPDGLVYMPDIPKELLYLLFGAQSTYLTGKIFRKIKGVKL